MSKIPPISEVSFASRHRMRREREQDSVSFQPKSVSSRQQEIDHVTVSEVSPLTMVQESMSKQDPKDRIKAEKRQREKNSSILTDT